MWVFLAILQQMIFETFVVTDRFGYFSNIIWYWCTNITAFTIIIIITITFYLETAAEQFAQSFKCISEIDVVDATAYFNIAFFAITDVKRLQFPKCRSSDYYGVLALKLLKNGEISS